MSFQGIFAERVMAPENEQAVCLTCGFCCDGTLFGHAVLKPDEKGNLPPLIEQNVFRQEGKDYFRLPCLYFSGRCTIYESPRADVCGAYRCRLLADMEAGKISSGEAVEIVRNADRMRKEITDAYRILTSSSDGEPLTVVLRELGRRHEPAAGAGSEDTRHEPVADDATNDPGYELLQVRCNILEALLIKHFRPEGDFESLVMKHDGE
mgnify:FL=1